MNATSSTHRPSAQRSRTWLAALAIVAAGCARGDPEGHRPNRAAPAPPSATAATGSARAATATATAKPIVPALAAPAAARPAPAAATQAPAAATQAPTADLPAAPHGLEVAIVAGGCFWGMEEILRAVPGVVDTEVGYAGGTSQAPTYEQVKHGDTGHAESVMITFDPTRLSYADLLEHWFFRAHDPTTRDRQGNDVGTQYRSAIFYLDERQRRTALEVEARVDASGHWPRPVVTEVVAATSFTPAEDYHQDYLQRHPDGYTCHYLREF